LPDGDYYVEASAPAFSVDEHVIKIRDITGGLDLMAGTAEYAPTSVQNRSFVFGRFNLSGGPSSIELQHRCQTTKTIDGLGNASDVDFGVNNIFGVVKIWKVG